MEETFKGLSIFDEGNSGKTIVFIHGFPFDRSMWDAQIKEFSNLCRVIAYDVRGFGESDAASQVTMESFVDDLILVLDRRKVERAVLCGLSMGGYIALRAVARHPERVSGLILCDTKSEADTNEAKIKRAETIRAVRSGGVNTFAAEFIKNVLTERSLKEDARLTNALLETIRCQSAEAICGALLAMAARTDTTPSLGRIAVPTLVLAGEEDKLTPPEGAKAMASAIPGAVFHVIPGAAHMSNLENPDEFDSLLRTFLER